MVIGIVLSWLFIGVDCWLGWQLLRQNGRILLRLDELEKRLDEWEFGEFDQTIGPKQDDGGRAEELESDQSLLTPAAANGDGDRANRFNNRSLKRSKIKRDGLRAGTPAPDFRLPCLDGTERSLQDFRGRRVV